MLVGISVASFSSIKEVDMVIHFKHFGLHLSFLYFYGYNRLIHE